jgi:Ni/Co efflux regulator RcnB
LRQFSLLAGKSLRQASAIFSPSPITAWFKETHHEEAHSRRRCRRDRDHRHRRPGSGQPVPRSVVAKQQDHRWNKGQRFDRRYARDYKVIGSPRMYRLYNAPRGYHWVQSGHDAILVGITSGIIAAVMANAIR